MPWPSPASGPQAAQALPPRPLDSEGGKGSHYTQFALRESKAKIVLNGRGAIKAVTSHNMYSYVLGD
jgi:hypothetical protein